MQDVAMLDPKLTINEVVRIWPDTVAAFQQFGLDTCCGGPLSIGEAAERHGLAVEAVLRALRERIG